MRILESPAPPHSPSAEVCLPLTFFPLSPPSRLHHPSRDIRFPSKSAACASSTATQPGLWISRSPALPVTHRGHPGGERPHCLSRGLSRMI